MSHCHLIQTQEGLERCRAFLGAGDVVVLYGAAVQLLFSPQRLPEQPCYFMYDDVAARGLMPFATDHNLVSIAEFVALLVQYEKQVSW